jgi:hypothetical protein
VVPAAENRRRWIVSGFSLALLAVLTLLPAMALAQDVPGHQLLQFARNFIIAPIALFAIVVACVAAFIRPEAVRSAGYIAVIAVLLFFLLANSDRLLQAMRAG